MAGSFLPDRDSLLLAWSLNFSTRITATPTAFGLVAAQATAYAAVHAAFAAALAAVDPNERSKSLVAAKNTARDNLKIQARALAKIVDGTLTVTPAQRLELGLNVRKTSTPIPVPASAPFIETRERYGTTVIIRITDGSGRRTRLNGTQGARVYTFVGNTPPSDPQLWTDEGQATRADVELEFPAETAPGTTVWMTAAWYNPRGQLGPACTPVSTVLAGGAMRMAA
jgi:hypothetical protein